MPFHNILEGLLIAEEETFIDFSRRGETERQFSNKLPLWAGMDDEFSALKTRAFRIILPFLTS